MNRRGFFARLGGAVVAGLASPVLAPVTVTPRLPVGDVFIVSGGRAYIVTAYHSLDAWRYAVGRQAMEASRAARLLAP